MHLTSVLTEHPASGSHVGLQASHGPPSIRASRSPGQDACSAGTLGKSCPLEGQSSPLGTHMACECWPGTWADSGGQRLACAIHELTSGERLSVHLYGPWAAQHSPGALLQPVTASEPFAQIWSGKHSCTEALKLQL